MEQQEAEKLLNWSIFWLVLCILGFLGFIVPGIVLNIPSLIGESFGFAYPNFSGIYCTWKLAYTKKDSSPTSNMGHRQMKMHPMAIPLTL